MVGVRSRLVVSLLPSGTVVESPCDRQLWAYEVIVSNLGSLTGHNPMDYTEAACRP